MQRAKLEVLKLMRENRRTRVLIILNCELIREELFNVDLQPGSGETELLNPHFQSNVIVSLEATDESEEFDTSMDTLQERIHNFNQRGSKWRFHRVTSLHIHLTEYRPLNGSSDIELPKFVN